MGCSGASKPLIDFECWILDFEFWISLRRRVRENAGGVGCCEPRQPLKRTDDTEATDRFWMLDLDESHTKARRHEAGWDGFFLRGFVASCEEILGVMAMPVLLSRIKLIAGPFR